MKSLMQLMRFLLEDSSRRCQLSTRRDLQTIQTRTASEGLSFLTITLPNFCKDFENCLDQKVVSKHHFCGFRRRGGLPVFLQGFLSLIFCPISGKLLHNPSIDAILCVRQICLAFKKYSSPCTKYRVKRAIEDYVITDIGVALFEGMLPDHRLEEFQAAFVYLFQPILNRIERDLRRTNGTIIVPKHGPGTTADGTISNAKFDNRLWTARLQSVLDYKDFIIPNDSFLNPELQVFQYQPGSEPPVRVVTVPKTLKTPRIIAIEPVHMQYVQQGLLEILVPALESTKLFNALGFSDQSENQNRARLGSSSGTLATIDLSEASDRVSNLLVKSAFSAWPYLSDIIQACRSTHADVPGFGIQPISKFASMGSALCFPIEAMVFLTVTFLGWQAQHNLPWRGKTRQSFLSSVRIYGDDIIIPVDSVESVVQELSNFNLKVNQHKSFWTGKFRESCGGDFYDGVSVKPVYIKSIIPTSLRHVDETIHTVATRNLLYKAGFWRTCQYIDSMIERFAPFPIVSESSPCIGRESFLPPVGERICPTLHRPLVRAIVRRSLKPLSPITGTGALMKFFLKRGSKPIFSKDHLNRDGRPRIAALHLRWSSCH